MTFGRLGSLGVLGNLGGGANGLRPPPGYVFLINDDGSYRANDDGSYQVVELV